MHSGEYRERIIALRLQQGLILQRDYLYITNFNKLTFYIHYFNNKILLTSILIETNNYEYTSSWGYLRYTYELHNDHLYI